MTIQEALDTATQGGYHIDGADGVQTYYSGASSHYSESLWKQSLYKRRP